MLNAIGTLIARKRVLERYLRHEINSVIIKDLEEEISEVERAIEVLRKHK